MTLYLRDLDPALLARAREIKLACFDVDGSLTDGRLGFDDAGREAKFFHVQDGLGLRLLEDQGIAVALVTARESAIVAKRANELGLRHVFQGVKDKLARLEQLCESLGLTPAQAAWFGDDLPDLPCLLQVGLAGAPADAHPWIAARVHWQAGRAAGRGAAREFCDLILIAQGHETAVLSRFGVDGDAS